MGSKYYLHNGKDVKKETHTQNQAPASEPIEDRSPDEACEPEKKIRSRSVIGMIVILCAAVVLVYSYIFASENMEEYIDRSAYEHLEGMYIGGLGEASYVFAQKIEDSVLAGILGLDYVNSQDLGEAVYTFNSGK